MPALRQTVGAVQSVVLIVQSVVLIVQSVVRIVRSGVRTLQFETGTILNKEDIWSDVILQNCCYVIWI